MSETSDSTDEPIDEAIEPSDADGDQPESEPEPEPDGEGDGDDEVADNDDAEDDDSDDAAAVPAMAAFAKAVSAGDVPDVPDAFDDDDDDHDPSPDTVDKFDEDTETEPSRAGDAPAALPPTYDTADASRARSLVQSGLGAALLASGLALIAFTGSHGTWSLDRIAVMLIPLGLGAFLLAAGVVALRRIEPRGTLAPARVRPAGSGSRLARFFRWVEPFEVAIVFAAALALLVPGVWSYTLIDPWEGHYAEVARRILEEGDWVHLKWQNEVFRSKPVLTFWLIAASMNTLGIAQDGGYSGELIASDAVILAVRLPFVLFGAFGIAMVWWMLARLVSRRVAWLAAAVTVSTTFYLMVARQAITDIPMVACVMGALACFVMTVERGEEPLESVMPKSPLAWVRQLTAYHVFIGAFSLVIVFQAVYYAVYFSHAPLARGIKIPAPGLVLAGLMIAGLVGLVASSMTLFKVERRGQVWMFWFYTLVGIALLAKGPPGLGLTGLVCLGYLVLTGRWHQLLRFEIPRGVLIGALVAVPWHLAMWMRDGPAWVNEYFNHHMFGRFTKGVHGDRGTFEYFASQIGIGMWPWAALVPAALATLMASATVKSREGRVRLIIGIWAIAGVAMFSISQTKFHHYILPVIPALCIVVAFFLDDIWTRRWRQLWPAVITAVVIALLLCRDLLGEQEKILELFIYRYDRPWPSGDDYDVSVKAPIFYFGLAFSACLVLLAFRKLRRPAILGLVGIGLSWGLWVGTGYMRAAAPHWGQRALHQTYHAQRHIHGVDIKYWGLRELHQDWKDNDSFTIKTVLNSTVAVGAAATIGMEIPNVGLPQNRIELEATIAAIGDDSITFQLVPGQRDRIAAWVDEGARAKRKRPAWSQINADRLITWQLNWRGENFWSGGEIWGKIKDAQTVFTHTNNKKFNEYIKSPGKTGRTWYVITEAARARGLKGLLPTQRGKDTFEIIDTSCNKFTLIRFSL